MSRHTLGGAVSRHRELALALAFVGMAGWELTEFLILEGPHVIHGRLRLALHSVQVLLVVAVTWVVIRAWQERTRHEDALTRMVEKVVVAQEEERRRIAHEVHDGIAQLIFSAKQHVDTARDVATNDPDRAARETGRAAQRLEGAIVETRRVLQALRPSAVDSVGLVEAMRLALDEAGKEAGWSTHFVDRLGAARVPPAVETAAFRILQESLFNAVVLLLVTSVAAAQPPSPQPVEPPLTQLPPILVTAPAPLPEALPRSDIPGSLDILTDQDIRTVHPRVLPDALERLPGVTLQNELGNPYQPNLSLRGFFASPVTGLPQGVSVFLDGVRINEPTVEEVNFDLIPLDDAELVEVIRGASVLFGRNTLGAAVTITTRRGQERFELVPEISGGSFGRQNYLLRLGGTARPFDYYLGMRYTDETGWRDDSQTRIGRVLAKLGVRKGDLDATVSYQYSNDRIKQPGSLPSYEVSRDPTQNFTPDFFAPVLNMGVINASYAVTERLKVEGNAFVRALSTEQFNANLIAANTRMLNNTLSVGGRLQASYRTAIFGRDNVLIVGAEYTRSRVTSRTLEEEVGGGEELAADLADTQDAVGAYYQNSLTILRDFTGKGSSLVLTVAGRWDYLRHSIDDRLGGPSGGVFTFSRFNPKVGVNLNLSDRVGFYASYGEGFRAPAFLELTCAGPGAVCPGLQVGVAPDPPLDPVVARTYEIGAYARPWSWLDVDAAIYRTNVDNDIFSVAPTGTVGVFFQNIGSTRRQGVEFSARARWERFLEGYLNYAYTRATFQESVELATPLAGGAQLVPSGSTIPLIPKHRINFGLSWHPWPWATLSAGATYVSSQFLRGDDANTQVPLPAYWVVNGSVSARWRGFEGFVNLYNVLNNTYETFGTFAPDGRLPGAPVVRFVTPAPPINVLAGLRYAF